MLVTIPYMVNSEKAGNLIWDMLEPFVALSCGITAIGYAKQYLNTNNKLRKLANEAVYPFYLLHQPIIVVVGYFMVQWEIAIIWKVILITLTSFTLTVSIYWFLIRPFNVLRVIFGLKWLKKETLRPVFILPLKPILEFAYRSTGKINEKNQIEL